MARVTTRAGDDGTSGLIGEGRLKKYHLRFETVGTIDEATSHLGLARALSPTARVREVILRLQHELYIAMAELSTTREAYEKAGFRITIEQVTGLDELCDALKTEVDIPNRFIVPGETVSGAHIDVGRTVIRRAERLAVRLLDEGEIENWNVVRYLNRCSDLLYMLARFDEVSQGTTPLTQG